jgi:hypothetical protein
MKDTYIDTYNTIFAVIQELNTRQRQINIIKIRTSQTQQAVANKTRNVTQQGGMLSTQRSKIIRKTSQT